MGAPSVILHVEGHALEVGDGDERARDTIRCLNQGRSGNTLSEQVNNVMGQLELEVSG